MVPFIVTNTSCSRRLLLLLLPLGGVNNLLLLPAPRRTNTLHEPIFDLWGVSGPTRLPPRCLQAGRCTLCSRTSRWSAFGLWILLNVRPPRMSLLQGTFPLCVMLARWPGAHTFSTAPLVFCLFFIETSKTCQILQFVERERTSTYVLVMGLCECAAFSLF